MEQWYGAFYDNALRGTRLIDPARQFVPDEFNEDELFDPEDSSIANAQLTANNAFNKGAAAIERTVPVGAIVHFPKEPSDFSSGGDPGSGVKWLECDGSVYNITDFPDLAAFLGADFGGDGVETFGVPNYTDQGRFLRSRSGDIPAGTAQDDINSHTHDAGTLVADEGGEHGHVGQTEDNGGHTHGSGLTGANGGHSHGGATGSGGGGVTGSGSAHGHAGSTTGGAGGHSHSITISDPTHSHTFSAAAGGTGLGTSSNATGITASIITPLGDHTHSVSIANESAHTHSVSAHAHPISTEAAHSHSINAIGDHNHAVTIEEGGAHGHTISGDTDLNTSTPETTINTAAVVICIRT